MTRMKMCGLTREQDVVAAAGAGADAIGFVMVPGSSRFVAPARVAELLRAVPPFVTPVAVVDLTDPLDEARVEAVRQVVGLGVRCVQFHGHEPAWEVERWRRALGIQALKAIVLRNERDLELLAAYERVVDGFLLDGGAGQGLTCDWELAARAVACATRPVILAGGLDATNVRRAISRVAPYAVDVASGIEASPGCKDIDRMAAFAAAVRETPDLDQRPSRV